MTTRPTKRPAGFTLIELVIVIGLISVLLSVALPRLLPAILYSELEGAARHLAGYGRGAIGHCTLMQERFVVKIDLDEQQYWSVRWLEDESAFVYENEDERRQERQIDLFTQITGSDNAAEQIDERAQEMRERFDRFSYMTIQAKSRNVSHEGILSDIGPLFDGDFELDEDDEDDQEEVMLDFVARTRVPAGVEIESVRLGNTSHTSGLVEIDITPLGLAAPVVFYIRGGDDDYYTVAWDPITGASHLYEGREPL